jgi:hypothetical protein
VRGDFRRLRLWVVMQLQRFFRAVARLPSRVEQDYPWPFMANEYFILLSIQSVQVAEG